jgi:hypothetical protein
LADDATKMRDAVEGGVDAGREQRVALLYCVERVAPLLDGCVAGDLGCKCMVGGKDLVDRSSLSAFCIFHCPGLWEWDGPWPPIDSSRGLVALNAPSNSRSSFASHDIEGELQPLERSREVEDMMISFFRFEARDAASPLYGKVLVEEAEELFKGAEGTE